MPRVSYFGYQKHFSPKMGFVAFMCSLDPNVIQKVRNKNEQIFRK